MYATVPSARKSLEEIDKEPYHSEGRTCREELADIPPGARKSDRDWVAAFLGMPTKASKHDRAVLDKKTSPNEWLLRDGKLLSKSGWLRHVSRL